MPLQWPFWFQFLRDYKYQIYHSQAINIARNGFSMPQNICVRISRFNIPQAHEFDQKNQWNMVKLCGKFLINQQKIINQVEIHHIKVHHSIEYKNRFLPTICVLYFIDQNRLYSYPKILTNLIFSERYFQNFTRVECFPTINTQIHITIFAIHHFSTRPIHLQESMQLASAIDVVLPLGEMREFAIKPHFQGAIIWVHRANSQSCSTSNILSLHLFPC